jgi:hypothetical protein
LRAEERKLADGLEVGDRRVLLLQATVTEVFTS